MGLDVSARLVVGISLNEFFKGVVPKEETYDSYDERGNLTGKKKTEYTLEATLPDSSVVIIGKKNTRHEQYKLDFYNSLGFDGESKDDTEIEMIYRNYDSSDLEERIIGLVICETGSHRNNGLVEEVGGRR